MPVVEGPFTVLTICTGNVNRSALAAALLDRWASWYLPPDLADRVLIASAGLGAPAGARMGRRTSAISEALGADGSAHRAQQLTEELLRRADLVLVASSRQRAQVLQLVPAALRTTFSIREAGRIAAALAPRSTPDGVDDLRKTVAAMADNRTAAAGDEADDIIDPQGKDDEAFLTMARQEVPALAALAIALFGMPPAEAAAYAKAVEDPSLLEGRTPSDGVAGRHEA
jgi:protein-tyrosine phosphatase